VRRFDPTLPSSNLRADDIGDVWDCATASMHETAPFLCAATALPHRAKILTTLPLRYGGLGFPDYNFIRTHAATASCELTFAIANFFETFGYPPSRAEPDTEGRLADHQASCSLVPVFLFDCVEWSGAFVKRCVSDGGAGAVLPVVFHDQ
jgi:hypothetical protein